MTRKFVVIPGICCKGDCRRVAIYSERFSDGWISFCAQHKGQQITLDLRALDKIIAAKRCGRLRPDIGPDGA